MFLNHYKPGIVRGVLLGAFLSTLPLASQTLPITTIAGERDISARFVEGDIKVTIPVDFSPVMSTERFRDKLLASLAQNKIDCGHKCVPKPVGDGVWECCDGRRVPPTGKVVVTVSDRELRSAVADAFATSRRESDPK